MSRLAVDVAALDAGAGDDGGVAVRPVVAAVGAVAVAGGAHALLRAAAELADGDDQRLVEQAALVEVGRAGRRGPASSIGPDWFFIRLVRPAWWSHEWLSELATFGQITSTTRVPASTSRRASRQLWPNVLRPYRSRVLVGSRPEVERVAGPAGDDQAQGPVVVLVEVVLGDGLVDRRHAGVDRVAELGAALEPRRRRPRAGAAGRRP